MSAPRRGAGSSTKASRGPRPSGPRTRAGSSERGPRPGDGARRGPGDGARRGPADGARRGPGDGARRGPGDGARRGPGDGARRGPGDGADRGTDRAPRPDRGPRNAAPPAEGEAAKKKGGGLRRTRQKARITKKSGDVRSKPDAREDGLIKRPHVSGPPTGSGIRYLRGLGHHLTPIVQVGKEGITDALVAATARALHDHELIKVKVGSEAPIDRKEAGPELATKTGATLAQTLGRTLLLYKRHPSRPKIELPR